VFGEVVLSKQGVRSSINKGVGRAKAVAFMAVPDVIRRGEVISAATSFKGRNYDSVIIAAPINIAGERYYEAVVIKLMPDSNRYYVHEVAIENGTTSMFKTGTSITGTHSDRSYPSIRTLLQQLIDVKSGEDSDIRYSFRGYAPPMYSRLQMEIEALKDDAKLGAESVIAYLRKRGVKAEEIRWSGIQAFLQGKKSVTKAELMEFVQGNELRVEDVSSTAPIVFDINEAEETITLSDHRSDWMHVVPGDDGRYYDEVSGLEFDSFDEAVESAERAEAELRDGEEYPETRYRAMPAYEKPPARPMDGYYRAIRLC
jgi:hypothetical protein